MLMLVECGARWHVYGRCVVVAAWSSYGPIFSRAMLYQRVDLTRLWLKVEHFGSQEAASRRSGSATTHVLLRLAPTVPAVAWSPTRACFLGSTVCLRICIVVHSVACRLLVMHQRRRSPHAWATLLLRRYLVSCVCRISLRLMSHLKYQQNQRDNPCIESNSDLRGLL